MAKGSKPQMTNQVRQWDFTSNKGYKNPFADVEFDVVVTGPGGSTWRVPGFWAGGKKFSFRFAGPKAGSYSFRTECTDTSNASLHGRTGEFRVAAYKGDNALYRHGRVKVAANQRTFEHADGTPFLWLGDTWWMGLTDRLKWGKEFSWLLTDRVEKGFNVVQIVAGLYPDMDWHDLRGKNEGGYPYDKDFNMVNPKWYDFADRKLFAMVDAGIAPCIVACWGYFFPWLGLEKANRHWRHLVARYGAMPGFWCLAGEGTMPYYRAEDDPRIKMHTRDQLAEMQKKGWTDVGRYLRRIDPFHNLISIHPGDSGRNCVTDDSVLDYDMLQTGHGNFECLLNTFNVVRESYARAPYKPVVESEVCYEGIMGRARDEIQRVLYWHCFLNGCAGFTYGANGIWQLNRKEKPYGASPHGASWGYTPWDVAARLPGAAKVALGKRILEKLPWWKLTPHNEWYHRDEHKPGWTHWAQEFDYPQIAGEEGQTLVAYIRHCKAPWDVAEHYRLSGLTPGATYKGFQVDPDTGQEWPIQKFTVGADGRWSIPFCPYIGDVVVIAQRVKK